MADDWQFLREALESRARKSQPRGVVTDGRAAVRGIHEKRLGSDDNMIFESMAGVVLEGVWPPLDLA